MKRLFTPFFAACFATLVCAPAQAMYKIVDPDGSVTYTDRPAAHGAGRSLALGRDAAKTQQDPLASLPFALREVVSRFPVTLYTVPDCSPCGQARELLVARGVPHQERIASSAADAAAWTRLLGRDAGAPTLAIGSQLLRGFAEESWQSYLDAAGYPQESLLPASYRAPPAQPLAPAPALDAVPAVQPPPAAATPSPGSGGFRF